MAMTGSGTFLGSYLPYLLRRADQTLSAPFYAVLDRDGVARSEWRVLAVLHDAGPMCVVDLAAAALSPQPTVTHAVRRLEDRGLVRRTHGRHDRRRRVVSITPAGARMTGRLIAEASRLEADALVEAGEIAELVARLERVTASVQARVEERPDETERVG